MTNHENYQIIMGIVHIAVIIKNVDWSTSILDEVIPITVIDPYPG